MQIHGGPDAMQYRLYDALDVLFVYKQLYIIHIISYPCPVGSRCISNKWKVRLELGNGILVINMRNMPTEIMRLSVG